MDIDSLNILRALFPSGRKTAFPIVPSAPYLPPNIENRTSMCPACGQNSCQDSSDKTAWNEKVEMIVSTFITLIHLVGKAIHIEDRNTPDDSLEITS